MIKWKGYAEIENTWEPAENLQCYGMIQEFEEKYKLDARPFSKYRKPNPAVSNIFHKERPKIKSKSSLELLFSCQADNLA